MKKLLLPFLAAGFMAASLTSCNKDDNKCEDVQCDAGYECQDGDCVLSYSGEEVTVNADITEDTHWTADKVYVLGKRIYVTNNAELKIDAGTVIKGETGSGTNSTGLIITQGATIEAVGSPTLPIIFTSVNDQITPADVASGNFASPNLDPTQQGLWGGLIILGKAEISASTSPVQIEGIPTSESALYGGSNNADYSGKLKYVSIRHTGSDIGTGNEIQALSLGGVGSATEISHLELIASKDDGIEFFGGSVSVSNVVVWNVGDDALDTDQGYSGTVTNFILISPGGSCFELDGPEGTPLTNGNHTFTNGTLYAPAELLVDCDDNTNVNISNIYMFGITAEDTLVESISQRIAAGSIFNNWEYTMSANFDESAVFNGAPSTLLTSVAENANTVGANSSVFTGWTWISESGTLTNLGL